MGKILVVSKHCSSCEAVKAYLTEAGLIDQLRVVDVDTPEGQHLVKELDLRGVPDCVVVDDVQREVRRCSEQEWLAILKK